MHSPVLYAFCRQVLDDRRTYYAFEEIEAWRQHLLHDHTEIDVVDHGTGRALEGSSNRMISQIAATSLSQPWKSRFLFRTVLWWKPQFILELGTSLGISSAYLSSASSSTRLVTVDGSANQLQTARKGWDLLGLKQIEAWHMTFQDAMKMIPWQRHDRMLIYLDGDHRPERVLEILRELHQKANQPFLVIIDDIRWSEDMWRGWQEWTKIFASGAWLDLFQVGIWIQDPVFLEPQDQTLIPSRLKPIHLGWI